MKLLEVFPHLENRCIKLDDDVELMYRIKYGDEIYCLNIPVPDHSNHIKESGGVLFKFEECGTYITTEIDVHDWKIPVSIRYDDYGGYYETSDFFLTTDRISISRSEISLKEFDKYWNNI